MIKGAGIKKVKAKAKFKIPISKEIEIINKWKDLDKADRELASARKHYKVLVLWRVDIKGGRVKFKVTIFPVSCIRSEIQDF